jgi:hypothetical protein
VDDLLAAGYSALTVLDLSAAALEAPKKRLGTRAAQVHWLEADVTQAALPLHGFDVWHDRAVFHFLTNTDDRVATSSSPPLRRTAPPSAAACR